MPRSVENPSFSGKLNPEEQNTLEIQPLPPAREGAEDQVITEDDLLQTIAVIKQWDTRSAYIVEVLLRVFVKHGQAGLTKKEIVDLAANYPGQAYKVSTLNSEKVIQAINVVSNRPACCLRYTETTEPRGKNGRAVSVFRLVKRAQYLR